MPDKDASRYFGLVIAFLLPGFLALWAISIVEPIAGGWLGSAASTQTNVGGFLFAVLASLGLGLLISGMRWMLFDRFLLRLPYIGVLPTPKIDQRSRERHEATYRDLRESHYYYFQFYANTAVALLIAAPIVATSHLVRGGSVGGVAWVLAGVAIALELFLFIAARDCIEKYRRKIQSLVGPSPVPGPRQGVA